MGISVRFMVLRQTCEILPQIEMGVFLLEKSS